MSGRLISAFEALKKAIFITASILIVFIALRNSLIWHVEQFWGASKSFTSTIWGVLYWLSGESFFNMYVYGSWILGNLVYVTTNVFFMILDITGKPSFLLKYKIQEEKGVPVSWVKYKKALWQCTLNSTVVLLFFQFITYPLVLWRGIEAGYQLPSFLTTVWHFFCFIVVEEIGFYYVHRLFHHPLLYKHLHKMHHEWTAPTGIISIYCHPLEHIVANLAPLALGPFIMGSHLSTSWIWFTLAVMNTTISHCGYHLPLMPSSEAHDYHHHKFNQNYGVMGVLDRLHGTDGMFRQSKNYERHVVLLGLSPARQLYPDAAKAKTG